jgi:hypothetical protein
MRISVQTVVNSCDYELTYFFIELTLDDLLKLYYNEKVISKKAYSLRKSTF